MPSFDLVRRPLVGLDSLPQSCGLSLPIFTHERIGTMPTAAACRFDENDECLDFLAGNCGLSLPTLFQRIGTMATNGRPLPTRFHAARQQRMRRPELALQARSPRSGPTVQAGPLVKTTPASIASGPAQATSQARLDNRIRVRVAKPSSRPTNRPAVSAQPGGWFARREPMSARAGPCA
jgi:hypothetical protein